MKLMMMMSLDNVIESRYDSRQVRSCKISDSYKGLFR